ncbi:heat shock protein [Thalictrum thalictroides]|uniref:Heat shock protein n=1 Tax=Thalictrum thalictroides TaxID=46969 RepID=A0A7J6VAT3_THATH|nr:heat shock protein [Thalictrum thalictroides]
MFSLSSLLLRKISNSFSLTNLLLQPIRSFRSKAALETLAKASEEKIPNLILYNYPSFSGAFAALFAHLYHSHLNLPYLILPFSFVEPLRVDDLKIEGVEICYLLDFIGPKGFATELSRSVSQVIVFDHRNSSISKIPKEEDCPENLKININVEKSSSTAVYNYFSSKLKEATSTSGDDVSLVHCEDKDSLETVLKYIEDGDLRKWRLPDIKSFNVALSEMRSQLNCITNPYVFDQLLEVSPVDLVTRGNIYFSSRQNAANKLLDRAFKVCLGRGLYGECLGIRTDKDFDLSNEIGKELSIRSAAAGLRPIGAVISMQRNNLKMCLRSADSDTDTSEIAKAYGGGGSPGSSSFIIRMDEYNKWIS